MSLAGILCKLNLHTYSVFETRATEIFEDYVSVEECRRCNDIRGRFIPRPQPNMGGGHEENEYSRG